MQDWWQSTFPKGRQTLKITDAYGNPVSIAYAEKGTGKPLILVHGIGSWSYTWRYCIEPLSKYFRVFCFDAKGYGFSEKPTSLEQPGHQVIELKRIIHALCGNESAIIVAISLGALISLAVVQEHPELCSRLVVINVPIFPERLPNRGMRSLCNLPLDLIKIGDFLRLPFLFATLIRAIVRVERREVLTDWSAITQEEVYWITYPYIYIPNSVAKLTEELQLSAREIERFQQRKPNLISKVQAGLDKIDCQTLIVWGDEDKWFPATDAEKLRSRLPDSQVKILHNCGHDAPTNSPEALNTAILEFLQASDLGDNRAARCQS